MWNDEQAFGTVLADSDLPWLEGTLAKIPLRVQQPIESIIQRQQVCAKEPENRGEGRPMMRTQVSKWVMAALVRSVFEPCFLKKERGDK